MANRLRVTALITLAMLELSTLGGGVAVARLLPARLALWQIPKVAAAPLSRAPRALAPAAPSGPEPTAAGLGAALSRLLASRSLGPQVGAVVRDLSSGQVLFARNGGTPATPASSAKLSTAEAALAALGPDARLKTRVVQNAPGALTLVGGGDPTLAAGRPPAADYPQPATLASLAAVAASWLRARHQATVSLSYDASLFTGPLMAPGWSNGYVTTGNVTPIASLEVDQGRLTAAGTPQDADNPDNYNPRSTTPAADAASAFAGFLRADGIAVSSGPAPGAARARAAAVASVASPPVSAIVAQMLRESNNVIAEDLARQVALRSGRPATFAGAAAAVTATLARLGVRGGIHLVDGSGLSPQDAIAPQTLAALVKLAATGPATLRPVIAALPVAGFSGTLAPSQSVFAYGGFGAAALGTVRAKTGNLNRVVSLTGLVRDSGGRLLAFAFMADRLPAGQLVNAASTLDQMATALAGCGCR